MRNIVYSLLLFTGLALWSACSNGDYTANPASVANGSINPLHPLTSGDFNWSGTDPVSANINGSGFVANSGQWVYDSGKHLIFGYNGNQAITLTLTDVWGGNLYSMGYQQYQAWGYWTDSLGGSSEHYYFSYLGNSGGLYMLENDSAFIKGKFYFQGVNPAGTAVNITNGYFNLSKM